jgi:hypothetical protein
LARHRDHLGSSALADMVCALAKDALLGNTPAAFKEK